MLQCFIYLFCQIHNEGEEEWFDGVWLWLALWKDTLAEVSLEEISLAEISLVHCLCVPLGTPEI